MAEIKRCDEECWFFRHGKCDTADEKTYLCDKPDKYKRGEAEKTWEPSESDLTWVNDLLPQIKIGGEWITSFATYRKTGERELTLIAKIYSPSWNTDENISRVKKAVESIGWTYKEAENAPIIGVCIEKDKV